MDVQDFFEDWDDSETMDIEETERARNLGEEDISKDEKRKDSADEDGDDNHENWRCKNCSKQYRIKSWFLNHKSNGMLHTCIHTYVARYVCKKTKDKLQRYCSANRLSGTRIVVENCT